MEQSSRRSCWNDKSHADHKRFAWLLLSLSIIRIIFVSYNRDLLCFLPDLNTFKTKYHIGRSLKISLTFQPAHSAFAMLQSYKLLSHFPATLRTYSISHKLLCTPLLGTLIPVGSKSVAIIGVIITAAVYELYPFLQLLAEIAEVIKRDRSLMQQVEDIVYHFGA